MQKAFELNINKFHITQTKFDGQNKKVIRQTLTKDLYFAYIRFINDTQHELKMSVDLLS